MVQWNPSVVQARAQGCRRGVDDGHRWEVLCLVACGVVVMGVVERDSRRGLGRSSLGHVDDEGLGDGLAAGEVGVDCSAHLLLGPQGAVLAALGVSRHDAQGDVWGVEALAQRVCVLFEDHVAHVVDQVVLADLHQGGRGIGPLDPDLAVQHGGAEVCSAGKVVGGRGRAGSEGGVGNVRSKQRLDQACIGGGQDGLAAHNVRRSGFGGRGRRQRRWVFGVARLRWRSGRQRRVEVGGLHRGMEGRGLLEGDGRAGSGGSRGRRRVAGAGGGARPRVSRGQASTARSWLGSTLGGGSQHLRPHQARIGGAVVQDIGAGHLRQLRQRDALAEGARAARRRGHRARRRRRAAAPAQELGARVV